MKIVLDSPIGNDVERHARFMHHEMLKQKNLPRLSGATRALIPSWCDDCGERSWGPVLGGLSLCPDCWGKRERQNPPGF